MIIIVRKNSNTLRMYIDFVNSVKYVVLYFYGIFRTENYTIALKWALACKIAKRQRRTCIEAY